MSIPLAHLACILAAFPLALLLIGLRQDLALATGVPPR